MKVHQYRPVLLALTMLSLSPNAQGTQVPSATAADQEALAAVVQELDAAYDAQDAARFAAVFAQNATFQSSVEGLALRGKAEIEQHFAEQFATLPPFQHVTTTGQIDLVAPGILAVDVHVEILAIDPKTGAAETLFHYGGLGLGILADSGWRIQLARLFPVAKQPAPATPGGK